MPREKVIAIEAPTLAHEEPIVSAKPEFSAKIISMLRNRESLPPSSIERKNLDAAAEIIETLASSPLGFSPESKDNILLKLYASIHLAFGLSEEILGLRDADKDRVNSWVTSILREQQELLGIPEIKLDSIISPEAVVRFATQMKRTPFNPQTAIKCLTDQFQNNLTHIQEQWNKIKLFPEKTEQDKVSLLLLRFLDSPAKNLTQTQEDISSWSLLNALVYHQMSLPHDTLSPEKQRKWATVEEIQREIKLANEAEPLDSKGRNQIMILNMVTYFALCIDDDIAKLNEATTLEQIKTWINNFLKKNNPVGSEMNSTVKMEHLFGIAFSKTLNDAKDETSVGRFKKSIIELLSRGLKDLEMQWKKIKELPTEEEQKRAMRSLFNSENCLNSPKVYSTTISGFNFWDPDELIYIIKSRLNSIEQETDAPEEEFLKKFFTENSLALTNFYSNHPITKTLYEAVYGSETPAQEQFVQLTAAKIALLISQEEKLFTHMEHLLSNRKVLTDYLRSDEFILALIQAETYFTVPQTSEEQEAIKLLVKSELTRILSASTPISKGIPSATVATAIGFFTAAEDVTRNRDKSQTPTPSGSAEDSTPKVP